LALIFSKGQQSTGTNPPNSASKARTTRIFAPVSVNHPKFTPCTALFAAHSFQTVVFGLFILFLLFLLLVGVPLDNPAVAVGIAAILAILLGLI
jgi:hypothetical protein